MTRHCFGVIYVHVLYQHPQLYMYSVMEKFAVHINVYKYSVDIQFSLFFTPSLPISILPFSLCSFVPPLFYSLRFCEEDIDQILERRTQVIQLESEGKGSTFSKASFVADGATDIHIDDPDFWQKWAKKANLNLDQLAKKVGNMHVHTLYTVYK